MTRQAERPVANPVAVLREEFEDWGVLFNPDTADAVGINEVGVVAWKMMDGKHTVSDIVGAVEDRFADVPESVESDINSFIEQLIERGFVGYEVEKEGE
ncbi:MAG: SynChlorMet cassette protein ScmD [Anaerolineae bacterium]